jgi:hypothetical protein
MLGYLASKSQRFILQAIMVFLSSGLAFKLFFPSLRRAFLVRIERRRLKARHLAHAYPSISLLNTGFESPRMVGDCRLMFASFANAISKKFTTAG